MSVGLLTSIGQFVSELPETLKKVAGQDKGYKKDYDRTVKNVKNVRNAAKRSMAIFPMICSNNIIPTNATVLVKALEREYSAYVRILLMQEDIIDLKSASKGELLEKLGMSTGASVSGMHGQNLSDFFSESNMIKKYIEQNWKELKEDFEVITEEDFNLVPLNFRSLEKKEVINEYMKENVILLEGTKTSIRDVKVIDSAEIFKPGSEGEKLLNAKIKYSEFAISKEEFAGVSIPRYQEFKARVVEKLENVNPSDSTDLLDYAEIEHDLINTIQSLSDQKTGLSIGFLKLLDGDSNLKEIIKSRTTCQIDPADRHDFDTFLNDKRVQELTQLANDINELEIKTSIEKDTLQLANMEADLIKKQADTRKIVQDMGIAKKTLKMKKDEAIYKKARDEIQDKFKKEELSINKDRVALDKAKFELEKNKMHTTSTFKEGDYKKASELAPTMLDMKIVYRIGEELHETMIVIGIKTKPYIVPSDKMIDNIQESLRENNVVFEFLKVTSGEKQFFKDFLFRVEKNKKQIEKIANNRYEGLWFSLKNLKNISKLKRLMKGQGMLPMATFIISLEENEILRDKYNLDLTENKHATNLMDTFNLLGFIIVDQNNDSIMVWDDEEKEFVDYTMDYLQNENNSANNNIKSVIDFMSRRV